MDRFRNLAKMAQENDTSFMYETTVGAGLPLVQAVRDRVASGDPIQRIEGVFSGTLSYLFNRFDGGIPFSQLVRMARDSGYTEPDPRDDLNGMDAARKLLILARISGRVVSLDDIAVENLVPEDLRGDISVDEFLQRLKKHDRVFAKRFDEARKEGKVLRYVAIMDESGINVGLKAVEHANPVFGLNGSENMVAITSTVYADNPLVIKGPGAGPAVTANGVLADILKVIH